MPQIIEGEEYLTVPEACEYLGLITPQTLRNRTRRLKLQKYKQSISPGSVFYRKSDLDEMRKMRASG